MPGSKPRRSFGCWTLEWWSPSPGQLELRVFLGPAEAGAVGFAVPGSTSYETSSGTGSGNVFEARLEGVGGAAHGELWGKLGWTCAGERGSYEGAIGTW